MLKLEITDKHYIVEETDDYAVVCKPHKMHCAPLSKKDGTSLLEWYGNENPLIYNISGRGRGEGGLMHRLDYETEGLILFAKNQKAFDHFQCQQENGEFIKSYDALSIKTENLSPGYPPNDKISYSLKQFIIESGFRPFGPGRKAVRPALEISGKKTDIATDRNYYYQTDVCSVKKLWYNDTDIFAIRVKIKKGFRHQIRCHLAWVGYPIINDALYGPENDFGENKFLALRSYEISFADIPGKRKLYRIMPFELEIKDKQG